MRTEQFIEMLQQADPSGEGFIMMEDGGVPVDLDPKPGYYDGAYSFVGEDGRIVTSTEEDKMDVICREWEWAIWDDLDWEIKQDKLSHLEKGIPYEFDKEAWFEHLKTYFVFDATVPKSIKEEFHVKVRGEYEHWFSYKQESDKKWLDDTLEEYEQGVRFYQRKESENGFGEMMQVSSDGKENTLRGGTIGALLYSGAFYKEDHDVLRWEWKPQQPH